MAAEKVVKGAMNSSLEICSAPYRGRGIKNKVSLNKGSNVLSSEPFAFVSRSEKLGKICDSCLSIGVSNLQRCSSCKMVYYCGQTCQRKAWETHKIECKHLKKMSPIMPSDTVRLLALLLFKNETKLVEWLNDLVSHSEQIRKERSEVFAYILEMLKKYLDGSMVWSSERIFGLFCRVNCNAFTICDGELRPIGLGLYQTLALLNHSCEPNCIAVFNGPTCYIQSIRDVRQGEELCISYTELLQPCCVRQKELKDQYYFECTCSCCIYESEHGSKMNGLKCVKEECSGAVGFNPGMTQDEVCSKCGSNVQYKYDSPSITQLYQKIERTLSSVKTSMQRSENLTEALRICEDLLTEVDKILHSHNYQVLRIVDKTSDLCIKLGLWNKALYYCKRSLDGYQEFYPTFHPSTAIQFYRIGKLEVYLDMLGNGIRSLSQAKSLLEVCYGKKHTLVAQLNELIFQSVQETNRNEQRQRSISKQ